MPRLIDADKLWKAITTRIEEYCDIADLIEIIETQPTVDAEPVVRCKDCKFYWKNNRDSDGVVCLAAPKDDAFCSEGERKEDVDNR